MNRATMPKMKSRRSAVKRFKVTATGKLRRRRAYHSHLLGHKRPARKRRLVAETSVSERDEGRILGQLPYRRYL